MNDCNIIKDLIPLYVEDLASDESKVKVENHIKKCKECYNYYERVKNDYSGKETVKPNETQLHSALLKIVKYTTALKLSLCFVLIFTAVLFSSLPVPFISTFGLLVVAPIVSTFIYKKIPMLLMFCVFSAFVGGVIVAGSVSQGFFIALFQFFIMMIATISSHFFWRGFHNRKTNSLRKRIVTIGFSTVFIIFSLVANSGFTGNPFGYIATYIDMKEYIKEEYRDENLKIKGIYANWKGGGYKAEIASGSERFMVIRSSANNFEDFREYTTSNNYADHYGELIEIALDSEAKKQGLKNQYFWVTSVVDGSNVDSLDKINLIIRFATSNEEFPNLSIMEKKEFIELIEMTLKTMKYLNITYENINFQAKNKNGKEMSLDLFDGISIENIKSY